MTNTTREEKPKEDKGLFLQLPYILIDTLNLSDSAYRGFINFCRQCLQKDKTIRYSGSYRQLATYIKQSRMTCYRSVEQWITANLIVKEDTPDGFILTGDLSSFWSKNADHCKTHQRPKMGQSVNSTASQNGTGKAEQRPKLSSAASQTKHSSVPNLDANEHENDPLYTVIDTLEDTFFSDGESGSYSQDVEQPEMPEKKGPSMADWFAELDAKMDALDQEYSSRLQENKAHQSIDILTSQESVTLPAKPAPIVEYKPEPPAPRLQTPAQIAQERKRIERHIWQLIDTAAGAKIGRSYTKPMEDLVTGYMDGEYLDEDFTQAVLLTKEKKQQLKFTNIVDNMADAALKRKKIIDFQTAATKKNNIDEEIEASRRAEKEFEAKERARKEQGKVFA